MISYGSGVTVPNGVHADITEVLMNQRTRLAEFIPKILFMFF